MSRSADSDQPEVVTDAVDEFAEALIEALAIVLIVSFISIGWRAGLVVAITIPLVLAATFALMYEFGIDLQRISLGALIIALGLLVDDAMIAVEMMERKLQEGLKRLDAASFAYRSTAFPMLTGTLITVAGFIPVGFAASTAGEYVRTLFYVVGNRAHRLVVRRRLLHALARPHAAPRAQARGRRPPQCLDTRFYRRLQGPVAWSVRRRGLVLAATFLVFAGALFAFQFIPQNFFPQSSRPGDPGRSVASGGTGTAEVEAQAKAFEAKVLPRSRPASRRNLYRRRGAALLPAARPAAQNPNFAQLLVIAKDVEARERLIVKMRGILAEEFPAIRYKVDRLFLGPPIGWPVQMRVVGPDREEVRRIADKVGDAFRAEPLLSAVHDDWLEPVPTMKLVIDQDRARAFGVSSERIRQVAAGEPVRRADRRFPRGRGDDFDRAPPARCGADAALGGRIDLRAERSRRRGAGLPARARRAGARAGHRVAPRPAADDHGARHRSRRRAAQRCRHGALWQARRRSATSFRRDTRSPSRAAPRTRRKAKPRSPPRRR